MTVDPTGDLFVGARRAASYDEAENLAQDPADAQAGATLAPAEPVHDSAPVQSAAPARRDARRGSTASNGRVAAHAGAIVAVQATPPKAPPATWGWRHAMARMTLGLLKPSATGAEVTYLEDQRIIRQATWTRAVNVLVTNEGGGTSKTPTCIILAGILASIRGGYVAALEATESRGYLDRRAEGTQQRGLDELLGGAARVRSAGNVGGYVAPQTSHADVLGSVATRPELTGDGVLTLRRVIDTYYRISITDSGNSHLHSAYLAALDTADAAVIPCLVSAKAMAGVQAALTTMRGRGGHVSALADRTVIVLGHDGGPEDPMLAASIRQGLEQLGVRAVVEVPFDPMIRADAEITLADLSAPSRVAWTCVAARVVEALLAAPEPSLLEAQAAHV